MVKTLTLKSVTRFTDKHVIRSGEEEKGPDPPGNDHSGKMEAPVHCEKLCSNARQSDLWRAVGRIQNSAHPILP